MAFNFNSLYCPFLRAQFKKHTTQIINGMTFTVCVLRTSTHTCRLCLTTNTFVEQVIYANICVHIVYVMRHKDTFIYGCGGVIKAHSKAPPRNLPLGGRRSCKSVKTIGCIKWFVAEKGLTFQALANRKKKITIISLKRDFYHTRSARVYILLSLKRASTCCGTLFSVGTWRF